MATEEIIVEATEEAAEEELTPLKHLHNTQVSLEKIRIQVGNRVAALQRGVDGANRPVPAVYAQTLEQLESIEANIDKAIAKELNSWAVWEAWLRHVKGIGPSLAGQMLALLLPPIPTKGPSSWYRAAGLTPEMQPDGYMRLPRDRTDSPAKHHRHLRRCLHNVATSFVRNGGYYRKVYEDAKDRLARKHAGDTEHWPPHRLDDAARWITVKLFLSHCWEAWCEADGIENRGPYITALHPEHHFIPRPMPNGKAKI